MPDSETHSEMQREAGSHRLVLEELLQRVEGIVQQLAQCFQRHANHFFNRSEIGFSGLGQGQLEQLRECEEILYHMTDMERGWYIGKKPIIYSDDERMVYR